MKNALILSLLLAPSAVWAQSDSIEGMLGKMPAADQSQLVSNDTELSKLGEPGLLALIATLNTPGDHTAAEYALAGYSAYVAQGNHSAERLRSAKAYQKALQSLTDVEAKAFLIAQLQLVGKEESVNHLASYLTDERLADPASRALVKINTPSARKALFTHLKKATGPAQLSIIEALGELRATEAVSALTPLAQSTDTNVKKMALYALANIGSGSSGEVLSAAAQQQNYAFDATNATAAYLLWLKRVGEAGRSQAAQKSIKTLISAAPTPENTVARLAAEQWTLTTAGSSEPAFRSAVQRIATTNWEPAQKLLLLQKAMDLAPSRTAKELILQQLSQIPTVSALAYASTFMSNGQLVSTAASTVATLAMAHPEWNSLETREWLTKSLAALPAEQKTALQKHMNALPALFTLAPDEKNDGFKVLFDGSDLEQWTGNKQDYIVENGVLVIRPTGKGSGNLYTKDEYADFVFRFDFQLTPGANNGLGIRTPLEGDAAYVGMELQILDNEAEQYKDLQPYQYHGSVYGVIPAKRGFLKPMGEWNTQEVTVNGTHVTVVLNGTTILDGDIAEASKSGSADHKEHPGLKRSSGHLAFLGHGSVVKFRNIRVKPLTK